MHCTPMPAPMIMKPRHLLHPLLLLLLLLLLLISTTVRAAEEQLPVVTEAKPTPDNKTVYDASKALCWSCLSQPLEFLYAHNLVRAAHLEFPLVWDSHLEAYARWWASERQRDCALQHSFPEDGFTLGENVFWGGGSQWTPSDAVKAWAEEGRYYEYSSNSCQGGKVCGHYTQLVWRKTWRVGCARVVCESGDTFMTCNYDPPGNYVGERPY